MRIIWTSEAAETFDSIMDYLEKEFSQKQMDDFYLKCDEVLKLIQKNPFLYKSSKKSNIRQAVLHKFTTLYY